MILSQNRESLYSDVALAEIEHAVPKDAVAGDRYPPSAMAHLDSERSQPDNA